MKPLCQPVPVLKLSVPVPNGLLRMDVGALAGPIQLLSAATWMRA